MKLKWGVYGAGAIAHTFVEDLIVSGQGDVVAAYARNPEKVEAFCKKFEIDHAYSDVEAFCQNDEMNVVYVATPHALHYKATLELLNAGKHVVCEKAFAVNAKQVKEMQALAKEKGLFLMEALWTKFLPSMVKVEEWIESGKIGEIKMIEANFGFHGNEDPKGRLRYKPMAGGALLDVGIYPVLVANWFAGSEPSKIQAHAVMTDTDVDGTVMMQFEYPNGIMASLKASIDINFHNTCRIYGTKGHIEIPMFWMSDEAFLHTEGHTETFSEKVANMSGYQYEAKAVQECLSQGKTECDRVTFAFSEALITTLDRVRDIIGLQYDADKM